MTQKSNIYFSGSLFNHKDIIGNHLLANTIDNLSGGNYQCLLPQDIECGADDRGADIRKKDIELLLACDLGLFHFDGVELDSGTVVEFLKAKELDMPSVIVRTDFRKAGDNDDYPWNLMAAYYPRTETVLLNGMLLYNQAKDASGKFDINKYFELIATPILSAFDKVIKEKPLKHPGDREKWALQSMGIEA